MMRPDEDIERVIKSSPEVDERWKQVEREWAAAHRLVALAGSDALTQAILADGVNNQLGHGAFSRVYEIDENWVLKLSRDWTTLKVMEELQSRSSRFPRIERLMENQAKYQNCVYHAAIVERLEEGFPVWVRTVVDGYRQPFRANSAHSASIRLRHVRFQISNGDIVVPPRDVQPLSEAIGALADVCWSEKCMADLRYEGNFMMRKNGEVVISDPAHPEAEM